MFQAQMADMLNDYGYPQHYSNNYNQTSGLQNIINPQTQYDMLNTDYFTDLNIDAEYIASKYESIDVDTFFKNIITYNPSDYNNKEIICDGCKSLIECIKYLYNRNIYINKYIKVIIPTLKYLNYQSQQLYFNKTLYYLYMKINIKYLLQAAGLYLQNELEYMQFKWIMQTQLCNTHYIDIFVQQLSLKKVYQYVTNHITYNLDVLKFKQYLQKFITILYTCQSPDLDFLYETFYSQCLEVDKEILQFYYGISIDILPTNFQHHLLNNVFTAFLQYYALQILKQIFVQQKSCEEYLLQQFTREIHQKQILFGYFRSKQEEKSKFLKQLSLALERQKKRYIQVAKQLSGYEKEIEMHDYERVKTKNKHMTEISNQEQHLQKLNQDLQEKSSKLDEIKQQNNDLQQQIQKSIQCKEEAEKQKNDLKNELSKCQQEITSIEQNIQRQKKTLNTVTNQLQTQEERANKVSEQSIQQIVKTYDIFYDSEIQKVQSEIQNLQRQIQQINVQEFNDILAQFNIQQVEFTCQESDINGLFDRAAIKKQITDLKVELQKQNNEEAMTKATTSLKEQIQQQIKNIYDSYLTYDQGIQTFFNTANPLLQGKLDELIEEQKVDELEAEKLQEQIDKIKQEQEKARRAEKLKLEQARSSFQFTASTFDGFGQNSKDQFQKRLNSKGQTIEIQSNAYKESKWRLKNSLDDKEEQKQTLVLQDLNTSNVINNSDIHTVQSDENFQKSLSEQKYQNPLRTSNVTNLIIKPPLNISTSQPAQNSRGRSQSAVPQSALSQSLNTLSTKTTNTSNSDAYDLQSFMLIALGADEDDEEALLRYYDSILKTKCKQDIEFYLLEEQGVVYIEKYFFYDLFGESAEENKQVE